MADEVDEEDECQILIDELEEQLVTAKQDYEDLDVQWSRDYHIMSEETDKEIERLKEECATLKEALDNIANIARDAT